jgi:hypothetical protein
MRAGVPCWHLRNQSAVRSTTARLGNLALRAAAIPAASLFDDHERHRAVLLLDSSDGAWARHLYRDLDIRRLRRLKRNLRRRSDAGASRVKDSYRLVPDLVPTSAGPTEPKRTEAGLETRFRPYLDLPHPFKTI